VPGYGANVASKVIRVVAADGDFAGVRAEFGLPGDYPGAAQAEAVQAAGEGPRDGPREDATDLPLEIGRASCRERV